MRLLWIFIGLVLILCVLNCGAKKTVEDDEDDEEEEDDSPVTESEEEDDNTEMSKKKQKKQKNKNRRMFGERNNGRVRLRGRQPMIRPPIFLLPPPSPVYVNQGVKSNPTSGVSVRSFGQPLVTAQAVNPGFSISNVRSAVAHNSLGATPNTFVVTPQVTSFQGTPVPPMHHQVSVIHIPNQGPVQISQTQPQSQLQPKLIFQTQPQTNAQTQQSKLQPQIQIQSQFNQPQLQSNVNTQPLQVVQSPQLQTQSQQQTQFQQQPQPQPQSNLQSQLKTKIEIQTQSQPQNPVMMTAFSSPSPVMGNSLDVASPPIAPPVPSPYYTSALADDIRCMQQPDTLTALLTAPPGYTASPFFNGRPDIDAQTSTDCRITITTGSNVYQLEITKFDECGVSSQAEDDGKEWLSISIRFPLVSGLKTPEDEVITIKCKPQDRTLSANHAVDFHGNLISTSATSRSSVFLGQERDLQCDLGLFRKAPGSSAYTHRVNAGNAIELGQELKLRAAVKAGDGWNYVRLTDVIVYRVPASFNTKSKFQLLEASKRKHILNNRNGFEPETTVEYAHLVLTDGCRNSAYKAIAPNHPEVDPGNSLVVDFNFKAFMFQTMTEGEAVRITARVTACVEQEDCSLTHCPDGFFTHGRKKRQTSNNTTTFETTFADNGTMLANTTDFDRNLTVVVLTANNREDEWFQREYLMRKLDRANGCSELLISTVALSVTLGIILLTTVCIATLKLCKTRHANNLPSSFNKDKDLWSEKRNDERGKMCDNHQSEVNYQNKKFAANNLNLDADFSSNPKADLSPAIGLKRSDSFLRSLQTFLAASLLQSFGRNSEENVETDRKQNNVSRKASSTSLNTFNTRMNTVPFNMKSNNSDELFIAVV